MKKFGTMAVCLLLATPAMAQSLGEKTGVNAAIGITPSTADFVKEAAISDMFEIQSSQLAEQKGVAPVHSFAAKMITDHTMTTTQLKSMVQGGSVKATLPAALDSSHQDMLNQLQKLNGEAFVSQYDKDQVSGHEDAVSLFQRYAAGGDNQDLKAWAGKTLPTLQDHLKMAKDLGA